MRSLQRAGLIALLLAMSCAHAKTTEKSDHPTRHHEPAEMAGQRIPEAPGRPPLAATPDGLFEQGGVVKIQKALEQKGLLSGHETGRLDAATSAAVMRFQKHENMAATGVPDHETIVKLGLNPEALFRHASSQTPNQARQEAGQQGSGGE